MSKFVWANGATGTVLGGAVAIVAVVGGVLVLQHITKDQAAENTETNVAVTETAKVVEAPVVVADPAPEAAASEPASTEATAADAPQADPVVEPEPEVEEPTADQPEVAEQQAEQSQEPSTVEVSTEEEVTEPAAVEVTEKPTQADTTADVSTAEETVTETPAEVEEIAQAEPDAALTAPSFDLVRIETDGSGMVAGQAAPGAAISILLDGQVIETASADRSGKFAAFVTLESSNDPRVMTLNASLDGADVTGPSEVIIAPIVQPVVADEKPEPATEQDAAPQVTEQISEEVAVETSAVTSEPQEEMAEVGDAPAAEAPVSTDTDAVTEADTPTEVAALPEVPNEQAATAPELGAVILSGPEGVKVLQSSGQAAPTEQDFVALDAITYGDDGAVEVSGRATSGSQVNVYLNNALSANSQADGAGAWSVRLDDVAVGTYTLRMDSVDETGKVLARIESPFRREDQQTLIAATPQTQGARAKAVTVQPGNTLWAIAREQFGDGVAYVRLFEANRDLIRDPDLIYPGQVFAIPE